MSFEIEKDIPFPACRTGTQKYRFNEMEPGDSILVPCSEDDFKKTRSMVRNQIQYAKRTGRVNSGWKFATRPWDGGIRVWRLA